MTTPQLLPGTRTAASMMQLPPSPEFGPLGAGPMPLEFSLAEETALLQESRFRSVARYTSFAPQTMACCGRRAALAGPHGIVLLDTHQPHKPCLILRHEVSSSQQQVWTALKFQKNQQQEQLLAAARGSGILVWDVSGNSLSPLMGRLGRVNTGTSGTSASEHQIMDLSWKPAGNNILATCTSTAACMWDVRSPSRPTVRFGMRSSSANSWCPHVQISCNSGEHVALMDSSGIVRVYDLRTARNNNGSGAISTFSAHGYSGVGLSYMPSSNTSSRDGSKSEKSEGCWVTWGLDDETSEKAAVKLWESCSDDATSPTADSDSYWFMDGSSERSPSARQLQSSKAALGGYKMVACKQFEKGLACARVCPDPLQEGIVTICCKYDGNEDRNLAWQTDLWKLERSNDDSFENQEDVDFGFANKASFVVDKKDKLLQSAMGCFSSNKGNKDDNGIGSICGAELAFLKEPKNDKEDELVLVCLTNHGLITCHAIPEAADLNPDDDKEGGNETEKKLSPKRTSPGRGTLQMVRVAGAADAVTAPPLFRGIYASGGGGGGAATNDPASALTNWAKGSDPTISRAETASNAWESPTGVIPASHQQQRVVGTPPYPSKEDTIANISRGVEGGIMQFDMEVGYGTASPSSPSLTTLSTEASPTLTPKQGDNSGSPAAFVTQAQADKVPCPPLCGAVFGGSHGLVRFHNGEVSKMWSWYYQQSNTKRRQQNPQTAVKSQVLFSSKQSLDVESGVQQENVETQFEENVEGVVRTSPRTLEDLVKMTTAAKEAQWGDENDESSADLDSGSDTSMEDIFDDDGSAGSSSSDSEALEFLLTGKKADKNDLYDSYFGKSVENSGISPHSSMATVTSGSGSRKGRDPKVLGGPSSDVLAPIVQVTHTYDRLVMNGQCPELAEGWKLGELKDMLSTSPGYSYESGESEWGWDSSHHSGKNGFAFPELPRSGSFAGHEQPLSQAIGQVLSENALREKVDGKHETGENSTSERMEETVRGGERSDRPKREESMVFLRKLFTYQKGGSGSPTMFSPPDAPMLPNSLSPSSMKRSRSSHAILQTIRAGVSGSAGMEETKNEMVASTPRRKVGVYLCSGSFPGNRLAGVQTKLFRTMQICLENADVCIKFQQPDKANVWSLLAQMIENVMEDDFDSFNGWSHGGTLGKELVANILCHFELQGDVQMLASIACVLGRRCPIPSLLPDAHQEKYDAYIRGYAELLYGWGLLTIRAEVNKHLVRPSPGTEGQQLTPMGGTSKEKRFSGVAFVPLCIRCGREGQPDKNVCSSCQIYAFHCSICTNAVRGLFTVCNLCGHGGHVNHIVPWFEKHTACPTGCGCACTVWSSLHSPSQLGDGRSLTTDQDKQGLEAPMATDSFNESRILDTGVIPNDRFH